MEFFSDVTNTHITTRKLPKWAINFVRRFDGNFRQQGDNNVTLKQFEHFLS